MLLLFRLIARLPLPLLHALGFALGWLVYALSPRYRRIFRANTALAGIDRRARRRAIGETGKTIAELPWLWMRTQSELMSKVRATSGWEHVEAAWAAGRGIVFLTPHLGCFEITAQFYASRRPITVLYRKPKRASLAPVIERGRGTYLKLAPADLSGVRALLRALKGGEAVGMLPDQAPGEGEGVWLPFFGRPAYTMTLAARLAATGADVILAYAERLPRGRGYHMNFQSLTQALVGDTLEARAAELNHAIEGLILAHPGQYLWGYNRYKRPRGAPPPPSAG